MSRSLTLTPEMLTLAYPYLLLLLPAPLLVRWLAPVHHEARAAMRVPFLDRLSRLTGRTPSTGSVIIRGSWFQQTVLALAWTALVLALARPQRVEDPITKTLPGRDLLVTVDLSGSMEVEDFTDAAGAKTDRVTAVKRSWTNSWRDARAIESA